MRKLFIFIFLIIQAVHSDAQTWEIGGFAGSSGYMGDINPIKAYKFTDFAFGGQVKRNIDGYWSFKLAAMHGNIRSDDANSPYEQQQQRNLNFYSPVTELTFQTEFNFFNYLPGLFPIAGSRKFSPYIFTGIGGMMFNPKTMLNDIEYELPKYVTENANLSDAYRTYSLTVPYGAGIKYNVKGNWNVIGELGYRTAFTDYLDDVSGNYPDFSPLDQSDSFTLERAALSDRSNPKIGLPNTQRGDYRKRDTYMFAGFSLTYTFVSRKCPTF
ncbi:type IX secretion system protein PorG [Daejeonella oryzae]|uniref:type IX secretion system protein PorG n=1 Tax=Daejeonella oryzae TaxID=1122943 RepID=UPI00041B6079|nr:DUF6089 family protein [Daejeonella oryzae]